MMTAMKATIVQVLCWSQYVCHQSYEFISTEKFLIYCSFKNGNDKCYLNIGHMKEYKQIIKFCYFWGEMIIREIDGNTWSNAISLKTETWTTQWKQGKMKSVLSVVKTFLSYHTLEITEKCHCMSLCLLKCLIKKYFHNNSQSELYY